MKLTPFETVGRHTSLQMGCSTCSTVRGPHSSVLHCVPKSHMKIGSPVASSCNIGTELGPPSEQNPCTFEVKVTETGCNGWRLFLHEYWHPSIGGGGDGGGRGSGGGGFGSGGIGASVKDSAVMEGMRPSPQSVLRTRLDMGRRVSVRGKVCTTSSGKGCVGVPVCQICTDVRPRVAVHVHEDRRLLGRGLAAILANIVVGECARVVAWHRLLDAAHLLARATLCASSTVGAQCRRKRPLAAVAAERLRLRDRRARVLAAVELVSSRGRKGWRR